MLAKKLSLAFGLGTSYACASQGQQAQTVSMVELQRFMGEWRVQGHTPFFFDNHSSKQTESYRLNDKGEIETEYTFERWGRVNKLHPTGRVFDKATNAHWKMQFLWPFESDYLIVRLAPDYTYTVVSVPDKENIWIMSREVKMSEELYQSILKDLATDAYPVDKIRRVPQEP